MSFQKNPQLELAFDYVRNTHKNIFLTGKAGTGKTTFLHQVKRESAKRIVVVAPTGVAAINAGGMTIHSFFQLPFGPFLPGNAQDAARQRRFSREKIRLIQSLDLLVIDEISMVRADVLDAIDDVMRRYRDRNKPFGGVQLLMIGDLHQLPPVVKEEEWNLLRGHYQTAYFFGSHALQKSDPVSIELKHIYRQSDTKFIELLNKVRDNEMDAAVLETLNSRFVGNFVPPADEPYITLTAHNAMAQEINSEKLSALPHPIQSFKAVVQGEFPSFSYPADDILECKLGAQVMFIKNDMAREKRYYNGKIGKITGFRDGVIAVLCPGETENIEVTPSEWANVKYSLNEQNKEVNEEQIGSFTQYPLRLAWAITIHKSQGLTFERAIIDAQAAFAHGQVYVALSRCKRFEGIVLRSKIIPASVRTDYVVKNYTEAAEKNAPDEQHLHRSKAEFQQTLLLELFDFSRLKQRILQMERLFLEHENTLLPELGRQIKILEQQAKEQVMEIAARFYPQIHQYFSQQNLPEENSDLLARLQKAGAYFTEKLGKELLPIARNLSVMTDNKSVAKLMADAMENLQKEIFIKNACFNLAQNGFSATSYLRTKADAELDFQAALRSVATAVGKNSAPKNLPHPAMFARLKQWREDQAEIFGLELYEVMPTRVLLDLAQYLPLDIAMLKRIKGLGSAKIQRFGADLVNLMQEYCTEFNIDTGQLAGIAAAALPEKAAKPDTKKISFELFQSGKNIAEIAAERFMATSTIEGHLAHYIGLGELDIFSILDREQVQEMEKYFQEHEGVLSEAKAHFGDKYSYGLLKMTMEYMRNNHDLN